MFGPNILLEFCLRLLRAVSLWVSFRSDVNGLRIKSCEDTTRIDYYVNKIHPIRTKMLRGSTLVKSRALVGSPSETWKSHQYVSLSQVRFKWTNKERSCEDTTRKDYYVIKIHPILRFTPRYSWTIVLVSCSRIYTILIAQLELCLWAISTETYRISQWKVGYRIPPTFWFFFAFPAQAGSACFVCFSTHLCLQCRSTSVWISQNTFYRISFTSRSSAWIF